MKAGDAKAALANWQPPVEPQKPVAPPVPKALVSTPQPAQPATPNDASPATSQMSGKRVAKYAGKLGAALTVSISASSIRKGGRVPNDPDDDDVERLEQALEEGIKEQYGDLPVPWYLGAALAAGGVYAGMRIGAKKQEDPGDPTKPIEPDKNEKRPAITPDAVQESEPGEEIEQPEGRYASIKPPSMLRGTT